MNPQQILHQAPAGVLMTAPFALTRIPFMVLAQRYTVYL
jgi:hypothetical protein